MILNLIYEVEEESTRWMALYYRHRVIYQQTTPKPQCSLGMENGQLDRCKSVYNLDYDKPYPLMEPSSAVRLRLTSWVILNASMISYIIGNV